MLNSTHSLMRVCVCSPCKRGKESDENWKFNIYARKPRISREAEDEISAKCLHRAPSPHTRLCNEKNEYWKAESKTAGKKWIICYRRWFYLPIHAENVKREKENRSISATLQDSLKDPWRSHSITQWGSRLLLETPRIAEQCSQRLTEKKVKKMCREKLNLQLFLCAHNSKSNCVTIAISQGPRMRRALHHLVICLDSEVSMLWCNSLLSVRCDRSSIIRCPQS